MKRMVIWSAKLLLLLGFASVGALAQGTHAAMTATTASLSLTNASATLAQNSDTQWTLTKTGAVDPATDTVTWQVTATPVATVGGQLVVNGTVTVTNAGAGGATLGNIVVNLQTRFGKTWVTQSSDIADATNGDAATQANIVASACSEGLAWFSENVASGSLEFTDADTDTPFPLAPQVTIPPGGVKTLRFTATFDNNVLGLPVGTPVRAEFIVTFGNASKGRANASNLDINGNGAIDPDEARVRSVPARLGLRVPAEVAYNTSPVLTDTVDDVVTTGTVTFANPVFDLGASGGTVSVLYASGAAGGTITNCAHLTGMGISEQACDTQTISPPVCTPGAPGCGWTDGDLVTYNQDSWGSIGTTAASLLVNYFFNVYPNGIEIGIVGAGGNSAIFTTPEAVLGYLPTSGSPDALDNDLLDPSSASSGVFGGYVLALKLDVDFSDAGYLGGNTLVPFGDLHVCGLADVPAYNNLTVREVLAAMSVALGGGATPYTYDQLAALAENLTNAFESGLVSVFAQQHLVNSPCQWADGDLVTYNQDSWGTIGTIAESLLVNYFDLVYAIPGGAEIGIPGAAGFSALFTSADAVLDYQPADGVPGALDNDLLDPTSTSSGMFGGFVLAVKLNVDFSDAGHLSGAAGLRYGDLRVCGLTDTPMLNGLTVRQVLGVANEAIGGGSTTYTIDQLSALMQEVASAFEGGSVSPFAQQHLVNGACPSGQWVNGDLVTYNQDSWGGDPTSSTAAALLLSAFNSVYFTTGIVEIGIPGTGGYSALFTSANAVLAYLPATDASFFLTNDLLDPTSTSAGAFGGDVLALQLNVDFTDANAMSGASGLRYGDLRLCGLAASRYNGMTIRQFLAAMNDAVGGGLVGQVVDYDALATLTHDVTAAFEGGSVSTFAQQHLAAGSCP